MPALFPLALLIAEPALAAWHSRRKAARRAVAASVGMAVAICLVVLGCGGDALRPRQRRARPCTARRARRPVTRSSSSSEYFFDVPLHARLRDPVPVIADWHDPEIARARQLAPRAGRSGSLRSRARGRSFSSTRGTGFRAALRQGAALGGRQEQRRWPIVAALPRRAPRRRVASAPRSGASRRTPCTPKLRRDEPEIDGADRRRSRRRRDDGTVDQLHPACVQRRQEPAGAADRG